MQEPKATPSNNLETDLFSELENDLFPSHEKEEKKPEHPHARVGRIVKENAPMVGALLGGLFTGGASLPVQMLAAGAGAATGSAARGDAPRTIAAEAVTQGALQGAGGLAVKAARGVAKGLMAGAVPKNIAKNFDDVDIPREMLDRNVMPGWKPSQARISAQSAAANAERDAAAATVPAMSRRKIIEGIRPIHQKAVKGKAVELSEDALEFMRKSAREVGPAGLTGEEALARKDILQKMSGAAAGSGNTRVATSMPDLANAERAAIVKHLRETPRMEKALNDSQALMAIDGVMQDAALSNPFTRARIGGLPAASLSPIGLGATAHGINKAAPVMSAEAMRAAALLALLSEPNQ